MLSLKLSGLYQDSRGRGSPYVGSTLAALTSPSPRLQQSAAAGSGFYDNSLQAYSATLAAKVGAANLTAVSGYNVNSVKDELDGTATYGSLSEALFGVSGAPLHTDYTVRKFSQELRLSLPLGARVEWLFGGFYTHEATHSEQGILATDVQTGTVAATMADTTYPLTYTEYAAFTDFTFHVTDRFAVQIGGRESENRQTYSNIWTGPLIPLAFGVPSPLIPPGTRTHADAFTYLLTPQFRVSPDLMLYARLASGYRPGGPNVNNTVHGLPTYAPDTTENYEIGAKADAFAHLLSFDVSVYYIDWKKIQVQVLDPATDTALYINGNRAKSQGVEFSLESRPLQGLKLAAWVTFSDAELTQPLPSGLAGTAVAPAGAALPYSTRFSGNLSVDEEFQIANRTRAYVGGSVSYIGDRSDSFEPAGIARQNLPGYARTDLRAGLKYELWTLNLFVNNLTNRNAVSAWGGPVTPNVFYIIPPRMVGLSVARMF